MVAPKQRGTLTALPVRSGRQRGRNSQGEPELPKNPEAEAVTIGAVLDWPLAWEVVPLLEPNDFYLPAHVTIWQAIVDLQERGDAITRVAVNALLATRGQLAGVGGQVYLESLMRRASLVPDAAFQNARIVFDRSRERQLVGISGELAALAYHSAEDMDGVLAYHRARIADLEARAAAFQPGERHLPGVLASEVTPKAIDWLWRQRIAFGKLALLDGDPGLGKGLIGVDIAARLSVGTPLPGDDPRGGRRPPQNVLLITPEDEPDDTIVPRLMAAGADLARIRIVTAIDEESATLGPTQRSLNIPQDVPLIERLIEEHEATFVIIDPIMGCLEGTVKTGLDHEIRAALNPLKFLIARLHVACLLVRHMNKSGGEKALYRGGGSIAFSALCRTVMLIAEHPDNPAQRIVAPVKANIGRMASSLAFSIVAESDDAVPHLVWEREPVGYNADSLLGARKSDERMSVIAALQANAPQELTPHELALAMSYPPEKEVNLRRLLAKMAKAGDVRQPSYGKYTL